MKETLCIRCVYVLWTNAHVHDLECDERFRNRQGCPCRENRSIINSVYVYQSRINIHLARPYCRLTKTNPTSSFEFFIVQVIYWTRGFPCAVSGGPSLYSLPLVTSFEVIRTMCPSWSSCPSWHTHGVWVCLCPYRGACVWRVGGALETCEYNQKHPLGVARDEKQDIGDQWHHYFSSTGSPVSYYKIYVKLQ